MHPLQVAELRKKEIDAVAFGHSAGNAERANNVRVFGEDVSNQPALAYTTPEHFQKVLSKLQDKSDSIRMLVFDEVHKIFDRQEGFRTSYTALSNIHSIFPSIPIVALTATMNERDLKSLCSDYLTQPVYIRGSVDRPNIRIDIGRYTYARKNANKGIHTSRDCWKTVAKEVARWIGSNFAIIYMDFTNEVKEMGELLTMDHGMDCKCFHSKNLRREVKSKILEEFCNQQFQVLCATESYEVGVHNPHVEFVARIGCMRNMNVLLQEIGRAGRQKESFAGGLLLVNENKDDQRLGYWLKGCTDSDTARIKSDYSECWRWVYCILTGDCLREAILKYYSEGKLLYFVLIYKNSSYSLIPILI